MISRCLIAAAIVAQLSQAQATTMDRDTFLATVRNLGQGKSAREAASRLKAVPECLSVELLAELRADSAPLQQAIADAQSDFPPYPYPGQGWLTIYCSEVLTDLGLYLHAANLLDRFLVESTPDLEDPRHQLFLAKVLVFRGELHDHAGNFDVAIGCADRALLTFDEQSAQALARPLEKVQAAAVFANAAGLKGRALARLGLTTAADEHLSRQEDIARSLGEKVRLRAFQNRAEFHLARGTPELALETVEAGLQSGLDSRALTLCKGIALTTLAAKDPIHQAAARLALEKCRDPRASHSIRVRAALGLIRLALQTNDTEVASRTLAALEADLGSGDVDEAADSESNASLDYRRSTHLVAGAEATAFASRLLCEDKTLDEKVAERQLTKHSDAIEQLLTQWRNTPVRRSGVGFLSMYDRRAILGSYLDLHRKVGGEQAAAVEGWKLLLSCQALSSSARAMGVAAPSIQTVQAEFLGPRHGALAFLADQHRCHLLAMDRTGLHHFELPGWHQLIGQIDRFRRLLDRGPRDVPEDQRQAYGAALAAESVELCEVLLPKKCRTLLRGWDTVTVSDYGVLRGLPLDCLVTEDRELLGETVGIHVHDALAVALAKQGRYKAQPIAATELDLLVKLRGPVSDGTLASWTRHYPRVEQPTADRVTPASVREWAFQSITHILAHGALGDDPERPAGLSLAGSPAFFGCTDADRCRASGLVVLSACGSGRGHLRVGDESYRTTLGGAFLDAGAAVVIQSGADLLLEPHIELMGSVHRGLAAGISPTGALHAARSEMAVAHGWFERFQHAQIQVAGLGHLPIVTSPAAPTLPQSGRESR